MEISPQEAPPGPGADGDAEEAPAEARSPSPASRPVDGRLKAAAKRVTFPSDEDIVSGAVEPKDPWRHAQNVTVDEVIGAYKQACQKLNCRQIPKLLGQLQEFTDLGHRIDCLDLEGEKLDYKTCEALEEVFKRLQFKVVDLEQTNLDEDGASALFDMIEYYESAAHLNISFNKHIGTREWQAAAHMMRKTSCLKYLDARNTPLLDQSAPFVARALRICSSLAVLHLENASLSGRPLMLLATALKMNMNLRGLYLADKLNGLQDSAQLGNLLKFNRSLQILNLRNNHVLDSGLACICEGLKEQRKGLVTLVLWNNQLTHTGMAFLGMTLPHTHSLETLNLGHNPIGNEGVRNLKNGLIGNRSVLRLGLASAKLTREGAVAAAEFIAESPRLLRLDLRENEIMTGGLMALSLTLKVNHSLLRLGLDREPKKEAVKSFIETQKALLAPRVPAIKKPALRRTGKPESPKEPFGQQTSHFTVGPPETSLETPLPATVPPAPKPRTLQPGKAAERRLGGGKPTPGDAPPEAGASAPPPLGVRPLVPQAPTRRKKPAPAAFHLQVLQSDSQLLQGLAGSGRDWPPAHQPDGGALFPQPAFLGTSPAASPEADGFEETKPEAASLPGEYQDPFWGLLHHPNLLKNAWLSESSDPLDSGTGSLARAHVAPVQVRASDAQQPPPEHRQKVLGRWVIISDKDKRTVLQVCDPLAKT